MIYTIDEHNHRLAAWDAATGARASSLCRFKVLQGARILEACGFDARLSGPHLLPFPDEIDQTHAIWRTAVIDAAAAEKLTFTHGVAAKLINSYLKARFVCGGHHDNKNVQALHPPIDRLLLSELARHDIGGNGKKWRKFRDVGWSKFDSETYQGVIDLIRESLNGRPLWMIEQYWEGYQ